MASITLSPEQAQECRKRGADALDTARRYVMEAARDLDAASESAAHRSSMMAAAAIDDALAALTREAGR